MARPTKLTENFIKAAEKIINDNDVMFLTDEELLFLVNEELEEKERISERTFQYWKAGELSKCTDEQAKIGKEFLRLIKIALIKEKHSLFKSMKAGDAKEDPWVKYAWILERKFKEWNLTAVTEVEHKGKVDSNQNITYKVVDYAGASDSPKGNAKEEGGEGA